LLGLGMTQQHQSAHDGNIAYGTISQTLSRRI
jgi:hypothetical protein